MFFRQLADISGVRVTEIILGVVTVKVFTMKRFGRSAAGADLPSSISKT